MDRNHDYSDQELIEMMRNGSSDEQAKAFDIVYRKHKDYAIRFMRSMFGDREELKDIYQDAMIVFYENINKPGWELTASIQVFLNAICKFKVINLFGKPPKGPEPDDNLPEITDWLQPMEESWNEEMIKLIISILSDRKKTSDICYEIFIRRFYLKQSYEFIGKVMGYKNARTAITRAHKCMEKLKKELDKLRGKK